jgi:hypothetical protein
MSFFGVFGFCAVKTHKMHSISSLALSHLGFACSLSTSNIYHFGLEAEGGRRLTRNMVEMAFTSDADFRGDSSTLSVLFRRWVRPFNYKFKLCFRTALTENV